MPVCSKCGAELDEAAKFCMECGTPVSQNKKCIKCGAELPNNAKFCFSCGAPQDVATPVAEKTESKNSTDESSSAKENIVDNNKSSDTEETFTDPRDGEVYKTCKIGNQIWMAENLRYRLKKGGSYAYDNDVSNVPKYGRLYESEVVKEACPPGWHVPTVDECKEMMEFVGNEYNVGDALRSVEWNDGIDAYGFTALPAGDYSSYRVDEHFYDLKYGDLGSDGSFWLDGKSESGLRKVAKFFHAEDFDVGDAGCDKERRSIRCIKYAPIENGVQCDFCKKLFNADKNPIRTIEQEYIDGNPIQKKDIIKRMCYGCQNTIGRDFIDEQKKLKQKYEEQ